MGSNSYSVLLIADNGGGTQQHLYALIANGVAAPTPMAQWRQGFWGSAAATGPAAPEADPDADGSSNLLEYALGGDPILSAQDFLPRLPVSPARPALTFTRNVTNSDVTLVVQASSTMTGAWTDLAQSVNGEPMTVLSAGTLISETGSGAVRQVEVGESGAVPQRRFLRLKVSYVP